MSTLLTKNEECRGTKTMPTPCFHCGAICDQGVVARGDRSFCCTGCATVFEILNQNGLSGFYKITETPGVKVQPFRPDDSLFLDEPVVREKLVNFSDAFITKITFRIPAIHCIACVWLLENLFQINPGINESRVDFPRKELAVTFENDKVRLSGVVSLLGSLGYAPDLKYSDLENRGKPLSRRLWLQLGVAGFAFGNIMLFSISTYFGLDPADRAPLNRLFGWTSFLLVLPVISYSAADYWKAAWFSLRQKRLNIEVPIAAGILALFGQSVFELLSGFGPGYFDSLAGLLFFLNCGKLFQQKTFDRLVFDRDYKSLFPLSVTRLRENCQETIALSQLQPGDRLQIRNGELIPADARLMSGTALIDYSFVTGESAPLEKKANDHLYAGGRQIGGLIEVETVKAVSQSYLTSLWGREEFRKQKGAPLKTLTNVYSVRFTRLIFTIALAASMFWAWKADGLAVKVFASVLIVACPCALALAAPFALGSAQRVLAKHGVFLKDPSVIETLAGVNAVVFDKTGTLTSAGTGSVKFHGEPLSKDEALSIAALARCSTHPNSVRIAEALSGDQGGMVVRSFVERPGLGVEGIVNGIKHRLGSTAWLFPEATRPGDASQTEGPVVHVETGGRHRGFFTLRSSLRPGITGMLERLSEKLELTLLSGDNAADRHLFQKVFPRPEHIHFYQSPQDKFDFVGTLRGSGKVVMMVGDGLNDAGALQQSDVGVAVVENVSAFSPASDVIMTGNMVPRLDDILQFSRETVTVVRLSFAISSLYNVVGIGIAVSGNLSPVVCAILMPLSSVTVVAFACGTIFWLGRRHFLNRTPTP